MVLKKWMLWHGGGRKVSYLSGARQSPPSPVDPWLQKHLPGLRLQPDQIPWKGFVPNQLFQANRHSWCLVLSDKQLCNYHPRQLPESRLMNLRQFH